MKLQTTLKSLVLIAVLLASAFVSYSSAAATIRGGSTASPLSPSEMKWEGLALASRGFQLGNA
jgi:hypothetical protein